MINRYLRPLAQIGTSICVIALCGTALAQGRTTPISKPGGYASSELQTIYNQSIGTGFTGESLNNISLANARVRNIDVGRPTTAQAGPRLGLGIGQAPSGKPFNSFSPPPTTSPYLNLFREDREGGGDLNYNTIVRPMLQQQQVNEQVQRREIELARRLQSLSAQSDFNPQGSTTQYPTGHQTVFRYYGHFYPSMGARVRR